MSHSSYRLFCGAIAFFDKKRQYIQNIMQVTFKYDILGELFNLVARAPEPEAVNAQQGMPDVYNAFGGRVVLVNYSGNIGLAVLDKFHNSLFEALSGEMQKTVICLEHITNLSRSALGAMVDFASAVLGRGKKLYLLSPPQELLQVLHDLQLTMLFEILHDQSELLCIMPDE